LRDYIDKALVIFPFEEKLLSRAWSGCDVCGASAGRFGAAGNRDATDYAAQFHLDAAKYWITLMPGKPRQGSAHESADHFGAAAELGPDYEFLLPVAPTLERTFLRNLIGQQSITLVPEITARAPAFARRHYRQRYCEVEAAMMADSVVDGLPCLVSPYLLGKPRV